MSWKEQILEAQRIHQGQYSGQDELYSVYEKSPIVEFRNFSLISASFLGVLQEFAKANGQSLARRWRQISAFEINTSSSKAQV